jgi:hypothetical protein
LSGHKNSTGSDVHVINSFTYTNASARTSATGLLTTDIGKVARQTDNGTFWVLSNNSPLTWLQISFSTSVTAKTADYTIQNIDSVIVGNASNIIFTLPTSVGISGKTFFIKKNDASGPYLRISAFAGQTIDGAATIDITTQYISLKIISDGSNWLVI